METITNGLMIAIMVVAAVGWFKLTDYRDTQLMKINYCWDNQGNHYVAPNKACHQ